MRIVYLRQLLYSALLLTVAQSVQSQNVPSGWRVPTRDDLGASLEFRLADPEHYLTVFGDFDGDGAEDRAQLFVSDSRNSIGLFVYLGGRDTEGYVPLHEFDGAALIGSTGIALVQPGDYETACGKGYGVCEEGEPEVLQLANQAIDLFALENSSSYLVWDLESFGFQRIWMSD